MNHLNNEIKLTIDIMQSCTDDRAHNVLQGHLNSLLEMKRERLVTETGLQSEQWLERYLCLVANKRADTVHQNETKPLTKEELKAGGWSCDDVSRECAYAFKSKGLDVFNVPGWGDEGLWKCCTMDMCHNSVTRSFTDESKKQIYRIGNEFYWSEI